MKKIISEGLVVEVNMAKRGNFQGRDNILGFPGGTVVKNHLQCKRCKRCGFAPWVGEIPGVGNGKSSSILAWKFPGTEEPGRLQSTGPQRMGHN